MHELHPRELSQGSGFGKGYDFPPSRYEQWQAALRLRLKIALQRCLRAILGIIGWMLSLPSFLRPRPALNPISFHPRRILVIRTDMLGDVVLTMPAIHALQRAYPDATIDFMVDPGNVALVQDQPGVTNVIACHPEAWMGGWFNKEQRSANLALLRQLRAQHYDLAVSICGDLASILVYLSGARRRVGFADEAYAHFLTDPVSGGRYTLNQHEHEYGLLLAEYAGGTIDPVGDPSRRPHLVVSPAARFAVADLLYECGIGIDQQIIALHAGSRNGQAKRWPLPYWARLADMLIDSDPDSAIVLIGGPGDGVLAQEVVRRARRKDHIIDLTGKTTVPQLCALLLRCAVIVTGDSGPLHIAEAVGTPVVALHGPTDPAQSGPCGPDALVIWRELWCSPCYDHTRTAECRFFNPICMKGIAPAEVALAVQEQVTRFQLQKLGSR
jgi:lipopolysaccharide heptosyltransferase II